jgi:hypothetical protein
VSHILKRGKCPYCGRTYALTKDGRVRKHMIKARTATPLYAQPNRPLCGGSGHYAT